MKIVLFTESPGLYKLVFDNSYSWFTSKKIRYRYSVLRPITSIDVNLKLKESDLVNHRIIIGGEDKNIQSNSQSPLKEIDLKDSDNDKQEHLNSQPPDNTKVEKEIDSEDKSADQTN